MVNDYWRELKEEKIKVSLGTKNNLFYTGIVLGFTGSGIIFLDREGKKMFLAFDNIKFVEPFKIYNTCSTDRGGY